MNSICFHLFIFKNKCIFRSLTNASISLWTVQNCQNKVSYLSNTLGTRMLLRYQTIEKSYIYNSKMPYPQLPVVPTLMQILLCSVQMSFPTSWHWLQPPELELALRTSRTVLNGVASAVATSNTCTEITVVIFACVLILEWVLCCVFILDLVCSSTLYKCFLTDVRRRGYFIQEYQIKFIGATVHRLWR